MLLVLFSSSLFLFEAPVLSRKRLAGESPDRQRVFLSCRGGDNGLKIAATYLKQG